MNEHSQVLHKNTDSTSLTGLIPLYSISNGTSATKPNHSFSNSNSTDWNPQSISTLDLDGYMPLASLQDGSQLDPSPPTENIDGFPKTQSRLEPELFLLSMAGSGLGLGESSTSIEVDEKRFWLPSDLDSAVPTVGAPSDWPELDPTFAELQSAPEVHSFQPAGVTANSVNSLANTISATGPELADHNANTSHDEPGVASLNQAYANTFPSIFSTTVHSAVASPDASFPTQTFPATSWSSPGMGPHVTTVFPTSSTTLNEASLPSDTMIPPGTTPSSSWMQSHTIPIPSTSSTAMDGAYFSSDALTPFSTFPSTSLSSWMEAQANPIPSTSLTMNGQVLASNAITSSLVSDILSPRRLQSGSFWTEDAHATANQHSRPTDRSSENPWDFFD